MDVQGIRFAGTATDQRAAMTAFLTQVLGLTPTSITGSDADFFALPDGSTFAVTDPGEMGETRRSLGFGVADLDQAAAELRAAGIQIDDQPAQNSTMRYLHFVAPDGRLYELVEDVLQPTPEPAVTFDNCSQVAGPFYHGTKSALALGTELVPGYGSNYQQGRVSNNIYFSALVETAVWGAELATALAGSDERGHIYLVEPTGPFEDDPNVTNKRFPGNPTRSYRTRLPLRVTAELDEWTPHAPEVLTGMLDNLAQLREQGLDVIED